MSKRSATEPPESRAAGKRRVGDGELEADADGGGDLSDFLGEEDFGEDGFQEAFGDEGDDGEMNDDLLSALEAGDEIDVLGGGIERQESEVPESESEEPPELPFEEEELTTSSELDFSEVTLSAAQARAAAELIARNEELKEIHFDGHDLPVGDLRTDDELEWDSEEYTDTEAIIIAAILKAADSPVTRLDLARNQIGDAGAKALALALHENSTLEYLNLEGNMVGDKGGAALRDAVRMNKSLQYLNLKDNSIGGSRQQDLRDIWQQERSGQLGLHL